MGAHDERIPTMSAYSESGSPVLDGIDTGGGVFDSRAVIERLDELDLLLGEDQDEHPDSTLDLERQERAALRAFVDDMESSGPRAERRELAAAREAILAPQRLAAALRCNVWLHSSGRPPVRCIVRPDHHVGPCDYGAAPTSAARP
jgi:hypothetical protein